MLIAAATPANLLAENAPDSAWMIVSEESALSFRYHSEGVLRAGRFHRFFGEAQFSADTPETARLDVTIALSSIDLRDPLRTALAQTDAWFAVARHPRAKFELRDLKPTSGGQYVATGALTLKGLRRSIEAPLTLIFENGRAIARGEVAFSRSDFRIGETIWSRLLNVRDRVSVEFEVVAIPCDGSVGQSCSKTAF